MSEAVSPRLDQLLAEARSRTGLDDFGDPWFETPLSVLLDSMRDEAKLNAQGVFIQTERLLTGLTNRLRIRDYINRNPGIHDMPVTVAAVIVGLGRAGSTMLQRLISEAEGATGIFWWETHTPVPLPGEVPGQPVERRRRARDAVDAMLAAMPDLLSIHPMDPEAVDEEILLLEQSFVSSAPETFMDLPGYAHWLEEADQGPAYRELREVLQALTFQDRSRLDKKWILKSPHHLTALGTVLEVFPEAKIVMPNRDPLKTVVSWCSLTATMTAPNTDAVDLERIGRHWSRRLARNLRQFLEIRDANDPSRFIDVSYRDLVEHPVETGRALLEQVGIRCTAEDLERMRRWVERNGRKARAGHEYRAADFGLDEEQLRRMFHDYRLRYNF